MSLLMLTHTLSVASAPTATPWPTRSLRASFSTVTPKIDGVLESGEWADAYNFTTHDAAIGTAQQGPNVWAPEFSNVTDAADSSLVGHVKYDSKSLLFAFDVTDQFLYAIDGDRWCPPGNPQCTVLNQTGWPWFGDEMEILLNAAGKLEGNSTTGTEVIGNETQWQMVTNLMKSRLGGVGVGGLLEGEPRSSEYAWDNYQRWIEKGSMRSAAKPRKGGKGYVIEWAIDFELMQISKGNPYHPSMPDTHMGVNIALGDVDTVALGDKRFGIRHENWFSGDKRNRTHLAQFGSLTMVHSAEFDKLSSRPELKTVEIDRWATNSSRFPSVWFGANTTGSDAPNLQRNGIENYQSVYFGWQLMNNVKSGCGGEEKKLSDNAAAVKKLNPSATTCVYAGNGANLLTFYDRQKVLLAPEYRGFFLSGKADAAAADAAIDRSRSRGRSALGDCPTSPLSWDMRNASARKYWCNTIMGPWAEDPAVDAIFVDEGDSIQCRGHAGLPTAADRMAWSNGSVLAYRCIANKLAAKGKRLVLSLKSGYSGAAPIAVRIGICPVPLEAVVQAMGAETKWVRFHEYFGALAKLGSKGPTGKIGGEQMCMNLMTTAMREAATPNMAFSAHSGDYWNHYSFVQKTSLDFNFAMFMVARNATEGAEQDYFGWSTKDYWYTRNWSWNETASLYGKDYGYASGAATQSGTVWKRSYGGKGTLDTSAVTTFSVDCSSLTASVEIE